MIFLANNSLKPFTDNTLDWTTIDVKIVDNAGNTSEIVEQRIVVDQTRPIISFIIPTDNIASDGGRYFYDNIVKVTTNWLVSCNNEPFGIGNYIYTPALLSGKY